MHELLPFVIGIMIGVIVRQVDSPKRRTVTLAVLCVLGGALASYINGELAISLIFISFDALLVWGGALTAMLVASLWQRRSALR